MRPASLTRTVARPTASVDLVAGILWGFRLEGALLTVVGGAFAGLVLAAHTNDVAAAVLVALAATVLMAAGPARRALGRSLHSARVRRGWRLAWLHCGLAPVKAARVERVPAGDRMQVKVARGASVADLEDRAEQLAGCLGLRGLRVTRDPADASRGTVTLVRRDPLADLGCMPWPSLDAPRTSLWDPIPLGVDEHGQTVSVSVVERSVLMGGEPGAGKSAALSVLLAAAALDPGVRLWLLDGKLVELAAWSGRAERLAGPDVGEAIALLEAVSEVMGQRYQDLLATGRRKIAADAGLPLHVVACDELAFYLSCEDRRQRARFTELLRDLVARGRAAGIIVIAATQKPAADVVPSALRDLFGFRLALRCTTPQASDTILGQGWASQGHNAATISPSDRGVGFLLAEDGLPVRLRTFYLDDENIRTLAARASAAHAARRAGDADPGSETGVAA